MRLEANERVDVPGHRLFDAGTILRRFAGLSCADLVTQARGRRPGLPVLVISGKLENPAVLNLPSLAKPFRYDTFNSAIVNLARPGESVGNLIQFPPAAAQSR